MFTKLYVRAYAGTLALLRNKEAASAIEYALIAAMVAVVIIGFMTDISASVTSIFTKIKDGLAKG